MTKLQKLQVVKSYFPNATIDLNYETPFQLLIAVVLSAQTTDIAVNKVTVDLFRQYPDANALKKAEQTDVQALIKTIGLSKSKSKNIIELAAIYDTKFAGVMPKSRELLMELPGVGQKTANVVLANLFNMPYIAIDTHIHRICIRLAIVPEKTNVYKTEETLMRVLKNEDLLQYHHSLIYFGRHICTAKSPKCTECALKNNCRYFRQRSKNERIS